MIRVKKIDRMKNGKIREELVGVGKGVDEVMRAC